jgi:hypothetical protein
MKTIEDLLENIKGVGAEIAGKIAYESLKDLEVKDRKEALSKLPDSVQAAYYQVQEDAWYAPENLKEGCEEHSSPSGKYRLAVTKYASEKGCWGVTLGQVYKAGSGEPIFEVRRNYTSFPFSWVDGHPNGHDYLVAGADYQGQTVLELDTGKRKDYLPESAKKGNGFCWAEHSFNVEHQILVVSGCFWACPYESRFFDFSDPMSGWPEIEMEECVDFDDREPTFNEDGTITCYQSEYVEYEEDEDDQEDEKEPRKQAALASSKTFRREGLKLVLVNEWVSEKEQRTRESRDESQRKYTDWLKTFRENDPLYLAMKESIKDPPFKDSYDGVGVTYDTWCPDFKVQEKRLCRRVLECKDGEQATTIDLEWGCETGPVKLVIYKDGKHIEDKFFMEHSEKSIRDAFSYAKSLLSGN